MEKDKKNSKILSKTVGVNVNKTIYFGLNQLINLNIPQ